MSAAEKKFSSTQKEVNSDSLAVVVANQMQYVSKGWSELLSVPLEYEAPTVRDSADLEDIPDEPLVVTKIAVTGELEAVFSSVMKLQDAAALSAMMLGEDPSEETVTELDEDIRDALGELFNLFCGATDRGLRKVVDQKIHVKQVETSVHQGQAGLKEAALPLDGWDAFVQVKVGAREGVFLWQFFQKELAEHLAAFRKGSDKAVPTGGGAKSKNEKGGNGKILIVDDVFLTRKTIMLALKSLGYEVEEAEGGKEALDKMKEEMPSAVMMDVNMPEMDGYETVKEIRKAYGKELPVIMCTCRDTKADVVMALQAGASDYLVKPVNREALAAKVGKFVAAF